MEIPPPDETRLPPRYAPHRQLPAYRYLPGLFPHPTHHPDGHSFGCPEPVAIPLPPERWRENDAYLYGVDLFNRRYYWEAHEAWEAFWHTCDKSRTQGLFIQGLIQLAAALLRGYMGTERGTRKLYREARAKLELAAHEPAHGYMGLAVAGWLEELDPTFERLLAHLESGSPAPEPPVLRLQP